VEASHVSDTLRSFCCRLLGFSIERAAAVEHAFRTLDLVMAHRASLVVLGEFDLVPIAQALHRRMLGVEAPFILSDWRRANTPASVRGARNQGIGALALQALQDARGGTLCVRCQRLPRDFKALVAQLRGTEEVRLTVVGDGRYDTHPFLVRPAPIRIPSLKTRTKELPRIIDEYGADAVAQLRVRQMGPREARFTEADRAWVIASTPRTLPEIEKATRRLVALRMSEDPRRAAEILGMAPVSLSRWIGRRKLPPVLR
jgi:hypothetical protein